MTEAPDNVTEPTSTEPSATCIRVGDVGVSRETGQVSGPCGRAKLDPKVLDVLMCLAQARGALVTRDHIMEEVWPGVVVTDFALSRCIYQLRKTLGRVSSESTSPVETLPKRGYRLAWPASFEAAPTQTGAPPGSSTRRASTWRSSNRVRAIGTLALTLVVIASLVMLKLPPRWFGEGPAVRISVLPLENLSGDEEQALFAKGLSREIMHSLAMIPGVVVIGQQSAFDLVTAGLPPVDAARRLNADLVLSGNLSAVGSARRVLLDLRSVPEGELVWSHSYLIERDGPFVLLPQLAQSVAVSLNFSVGNDDSAGTENLEAFETYLTSFEAQTLDARRQLLMRVVELDPEWAAAWVQLAGLEVMPVWNGMQSAEDAWQRAKPWLDRAFELDPDLSLAHVTLGRFQRDRGDMDGAIRSFRRALEIDPGNGWASANLGLVLRFIGSFDEALAIHETAVMMDPLSALSQARLGTSYWFTGDFEAAERHYRTAMDLDPTNEEIYDSWAAMLGPGLGRFDEALAMMERKMQLPGEPTVRTLSMLGRLSSLLGADEAAIGYWQSGLAINPDHAGIRENLMIHHLERGDESAAREAAWALLEPDPTNAPAHQALAILDFEHGDAGAFAARIHQAYPHYFDETPESGRPNPVAALLVALTHQVEGRDDEKRRVLQAIEEAYTDPHAWQYMALAGAHALRDEPETALRYLRLSPPGRVRLQAQLMMRDPVYASLRGREEFRQIVAGHLEEMDRQRSRAGNELVARGAVSGTTLSSE